MATTLLQIGAEVTVFERSTGELRDRGAGVGLPAALVEELVRREILDADIETTEMRRRRWYTRDGDAPLGRLIWEQTHRSAGTSWGTLWRQLKRQIPESAFRWGETVAAVENGHGRVTLGIEGRGAESFDLVVAADGFRSTVRELVFANVERTYSGSVAWRGWFPELSGGIVEESGIDDRSLHTILWPHGQQNFLFLPGSGGARPGGRLLNFVLYDTLADAPFVDSLADADGIVRSAPPGGLTEEQRNYLEELARTRMPPTFAELTLAAPEPMLTPLFDVLSPTYACGRVVLCGDAGATARPMTGSGATKALQDALELADALAAERTVGAALARYEAVRAPSGRRVVGLGQRLGALIMETPRDWATVDAAELERLFGDAVGDDWQRFGDAKAAGV